MIIVYYGNDSSKGKIIRPAPFVSIGFEAQRNKLGYMGGTYSIVLTGNILASGGSPVAETGNSLVDRLKSQGANFDDNIANNPQLKYIKVSGEAPVAASRAFGVVNKQQSIRALFARDGQKMEISPITNDAPYIVCYPSVQSINFEPGTYFDTCKYTINLTADVLYDKFGKELKESFPLLTSEENKFNKKYTLDNDSRENYQFPSGLLVEDFNDTWSLEADEGFFNITQQAGTPTRNVPRAYRLSRNLSATGKVIYTNENKRYEAWESAKKFIKNILLDEENTQYSPNDRYKQFPGVSGGKNFGYSLLEISGVYQSYNHVRTENIDVSAGTYSVSDSWILTSGNNNTTENYEMSISSSIDSPFINVSINGKITALSSKGINSSDYQTSFINAIKEYNRLSNNDQFGYSCQFYKRSANLTPLFINPTPVNHNVTINKAAGEIDYSITFDNRPLTFFSNVLAENITVTDTYPGDIYALMPTLNRTTGPLFQYLGGITQYERSLNIDFIVDNNFLMNSAAILNQKPHYLMKSPSKNPNIPLYSELAKLIISFSPKSEPTIRKYVLNPISESWNPKTGQYSANISWVYELKDGPPPTEE